jgi:periplasmic copper chaperone A
MRTYKKEEQTMSIGSTATALAISLAVLLSNAACAHPSLERQEAAVGAPYKAVVRVPHGCDGSPTVRVRVQIPEGVIGVKPMPKPGWTIETTRGAYAEAHPYYHGAVLKEGVREIVWNGRLADDNYDEFVFVGFMAKTLLGGGRLHFPTFQECEQGQQAWADIPAAGQSSHDVKHPAPVLRLVQAQAPAHDHGKAHAPAPKTYKAGSLVIEAPWSRATPGGARVAAGFLKIINTGKEADRLVGGTIEVAKKLEIHEMKMTDNVMRMRRLPKGLEIKPGETVELKPSSYHLMFMDLARPLKADDMVKGILRFERAGEVSVEYRVAPLGAQPKGGHKHH